jgi:hypothetical protein
MFPPTSALRKFQIQCDLETVIGSIERNMGYFAGFQVFSLLRSQIACFEIELRGVPHGVANVHSRDLMKLNREFVYSADFKELNRTLSRVGEAVLGKRVKKIRAYETISLSRAYAATHTKATYMAFGESRWRYTFERDL